MNSKNIKSIFSYRNHYCCFCLYQFQFNTYKLNVYIYAFIFLFRFRPIFWRIQALIYIYSLYKQLMQKNPFIFNFYSKIKKCFFIFFFNIIYKFTVLLKGRNRILFHSNNYLKNRVVEYKVKLVFLV